VRDCAWQEVPWLARLQLRPPDSKPVANRRDKIDRVLTDVARELAAIARSASHDSTAPQARDASLISYREGVKRWATTEAWTGDPIPISAESSVATEPADARELLSAWLSRKEPRHCVLLGDPGSGKSGLVKRRTWAPPASAHRRLRTSHLARAGLEGATTSEPANPSGPGLPGLSVPPVGWRDTRIGRRCGQAPGAPRLSIYSVHATTAGCCTSQRTRTG